MIQNFSFLSCFMLFKLTTKHTTMPPLLVDKMKLKPSLMCKIFILYFLTVDTLDFSRLEISDVSLRTIILSECWNDISKPKMASTFNLTIFPDHYYAAINSFLCLWAHMQVNLKHTTAWSSIAVSKVVSRDFRFRHRLGTIQDKAPCILSSEA